MPVSIMPPSVATILNGNLDLNSMFRTLRYRLALDIGTTSLGWCLLRLNTETPPAPCAIIKMGVRIFSDGRAPKTGESLAVNRRIARLQRRRRDRLLQRKAQLERALIDFNFWPSEPTQCQLLSSLDPYQLRAKGLDHALTPAEFGRALFHLNQRRGFKSNRKTDAADIESGALKTAISNLKQQLIEQKYRTVGEYLAHRHAQRQGTRARLRHGGTKQQTYDLYIDRALIEAEFDTLWQHQAVYHPMLYNDAAYQRLKHILLFQRPLKPVKAGRCSLLPEQERAALALPSTQEFRILQELNHLRYLNQDMTQISLTLNQRNTVLQALNTQSTLKFTAIAKLLGLPLSTVFNYQEDAKRDRLKGNLTHVLMQHQSAFGAAWHDFSKIVQDDITTQLIHQDNEHTLIAWLMDKTSIDETKASVIANLSLPEGYGSVSHAAILRISPHLIKHVMTYDKAVLAAGFDSHSNLSPARDGEILPELPYYGAALTRSVGFGTNNPNDSDDKRYGRIANPTVHIGLNQVRRVVNAILKQYGHPTEIIVEVTRDLKISKQRQYDIQKEQKKNQDRNHLYLAEACQALNINPDYLDSSKRRNLSQKMQLWHELNYQQPHARACPYTGEIISLTQLLSPQVEIEHILPYARTFDDTLHNKTLAMVRANRDKGNQTPFEAFGSSPQGYDYAAILDRVKTLPLNKRKRFAPDGYAQWLGKEGGNFMARSLNDTAYLSKIAREYLQLICPAPNAVRAIPGRMTALIRGKFGLNQLLSGDDTKNRNDHRHHALDAAVIGITDMALLQKFSRASASAKEHQMTRLLNQLDPPWATYHQHVARGLAHITVSFKPNHSYEGAMHQDTAWGLLGDGEVQKRVLKPGDTSRTKVIEKKHVIEINSTRNRTRHGVDQNGVPLPYKGYVSGSNDCIEIWQNDKGKWDSEVITTWAAYQTVRQLGRDKGYKKLRHPTLTQQGKPLIMRLMINDMVRMNLEGQWKIMRIVKMSGNQVFFAPHNKANVAVRDVNKEDPFNIVSKTSGSLQKTLAKKITVNELGIIHK